MCLKGRCGGAEGLYDTRCSRYIGTPAQLPPASRRRAALRALPQHRDHTDGGEAGSAAATNEKPHIVSDRQDTLSNRSLHFSKAATLGRPCYPRPLDGTGAAPGSWAGLRAASGAWSTVVYKPVRRVFSAQSALCRQG